jgi:hypothetical protein
MIVIKSVLWRAPVEPYTFYIFRLLWNRGEIGNKLSVSFRRKVWQFRREWRDWEITFLGVRVHYKTGYGRVV